MNANGNINGNNNGNNNGINMDNDNKRRKVKLINRSFQFELMAKFILINTIILVLFGVLIYIFFNSEISAELASAHTTLRNMSQMLMPIVLTLSVINILISALVITAVVLYASHRVAGPWFRFNEALKAMASGNLAPLTKIREDDQLQEISVSLGEAAARLGGDFNRIKQLVEEMKSHANTPELKEKLEALEAITGGYGE